MTKIDLELLCDPEQFLFVYSWRVSVVGHRHATAKNEFVSNYNPDGPTSSILFVNAINLYGHEISQPLSTGNFKFLSQKEIEEFYMSKASATDDVGFILEFDLKYPAHLHESLNDYPLTAGTIKITHDILSLIGVLHVSSRPKRRWRQRPDSKT